MDVVPPRRVSAPCASAVGGSAAATLDAGVRAGSGASTARGTAGAGRALRGRARGAPAPRGPGRRDVASSAAGRSARRPRSGAPASETVAAVASCRSRRAPRRAGATPLRLAAAAPRRQCPRGIAAPPPSVQTPHRRSSVEVWCGPAVPQKASRADADAQARGGADGPAPARDFAGTCGGNRPTPAPSRHAPRRPARCCSQLPCCSPPAPASRRAAPDAAPPATGGARAEGRPPPGRRRRALADTLGALVSEAYDLARHDAVAAADGASTRPPTPVVLGGRAGRVTTSRGAAQLQISGSGSASPQHARPRFVLGPRHVTVLGPDAAVLTTDLRHRAPHAGGPAAHAARRVDGGGSSGAGGRWVIVQEHLSRPPAAVRPRGRRDQAAAAGGAMRPRAPSPVASST
jgi:hypothetical protein